jgi:hypothetical protein
MTVFEAYEEIKKSVKDCEVNKNPEIRKIKKGWKYPDYTYKEYKCTFTFRDGNRNQVLFAISDYSEYERVYLGQKTIDAAVAVNRSSTQLSKVGGTEYIYENRNCCTTNVLFYKWVRTKEGWKLYRDTLTEDFTDFRGVVLPLKTHLKTLFKELYFHNKTVSYYFNYDKK